MGWVLGMLSSEQAVGYHQTAKEMKPVDRRRLASYNAPQFLQGAPAMPAKDKIPAATQPYYDQISAITDTICHEHLNEEYAAMCRKLAGALARKRPSPIVRGKPEIWAAGVLHALGMVNFLFDSAQTPHVRSEELSAFCGVAQSSMAAKSKLIREMFDMMPLDPKWCLPSRIDSNPMVWYIMVNDYIIDVRTAPREIQEEAYRLGLIPYIPADRLPADESAAPAADRPRCGLCGSTDKPLRRTACCNHWVCDDEDQYVLFSFAHNSCARNHNRYTLCSYHHNEGHAGAWQDCEQCRASFETEIYVYYGTNEYNFETLPHPPAFEPTHCAGCGRVISLGHDGYMQSGKDYFCQRCANKRMQETIRSEHAVPPRRRRRGGR